MIDSGKRIFWVRLGVIFSILYSLTIGVYFMCFYKPYEMISNNVDFYVIDEINQMLKSSHRKDVVWILVFSFIICIFVSYIILIFITPVTEVNAKLKSKEAGTKMVVSRGGGANIMNTYKLTFELDNGDEMSFPVNDIHYVTILEGNKGIMKYKKGLVNGYVGFYVTEIE